MKKLWNNWKKKWQVETDRRMLWIFMIFAITGSLTVVIRKGVFQLLNLQINNLLLFVLVKLVAIYIVYQILLFIIGSVLGEHRFVKWFILKMNKRFVPRKRKKA